ncbi:alpha-glucosidase family protein [Mesorhizobium sp. BAC0120]|uniref:beta-galactosidase BglA n=1 Tax=Mesorhizobium sp. BAC0120 TaxID=3090670 RepID=UPI00298C5A9A|nr:alpha-glucosidase family protein [Mesorhizobium sp. BAC0120]MDW6020990.1 alpha-glucosidase family protein [Mesorhizobium sp. BAC0120]
MSEAGNPAWWRGSVIYQVYPRSFQDTTGDGTGDLSGITARLPYIASLGVDAIWLSPFFKSPMADMGYDVSDYEAVDPLFGTLEDFDGLVAEAHRLNLKVIIDQVLSHSSDQHPWFRESRSSRDNPKADWYVWADPKPDGTAPNNWLSVFGGPAWEWDGTRKQYYLHNFLASQPDLNFHEPDVQDALLKAVRFWLERGVDGFRLDTVNFYFHDSKLRDNPPKQQRAVVDVPATNPYGYQDHLYDKTQPENPGFLKRFRALLDEYPDRTSVGEVGDEGRALKTVALYTSGGDKLHMCYTFDLLSPAFSAAHVRKSVADFEEAVADGWICWAFSNHDVMRHVSRWTPPDGNTDRMAEFAIELLISLRGSICLYQGEELGLEEAELAFEDLRDPYGIRFWPAFKGRDGCRTPMVWEAAAPNGGFTTGKPWLPIPEAHLRRTVDRQEGDPSSVLAHYRDMLDFRRRHPALVNGDIRFLDSDDNVLAFLRPSENERLLCVFNFANEACEWEVPAELGALELIEHAGKRAEFDGQAIRLGGLSSFFARTG